MNISYRWLQSLAPDIEGTPQEIADRLASYGAPADEIVDLAANLRDLVVARVIEAKRHPNADRLSLCVVDAGGPELLSVVCGAPNVQADAFYPFAPVGASLPNGMTIRRAKIRGETSEGMLCSPSEIGLGRDSSGILTLHGTFVPGEPFAGALGLDDVRFLLDIGPNRGDLLSHVGIARELAGDAVRLPSFPGDHDAGRALALEGAAAGEITVRIDDEDGCPRYLGVLIRGVRIAPSPAWLDARLRAIGQRPINNVVDATNYILHEVGQPLHAFDAAKLGGSVVVRRARQGEALRTLDGVERKLDASMLVIADAARPVALAGLMGGADTEVTDVTTDVFLECALFEPKTIRRTRTTLGMSTDASYRFERGVDPENLENALRRAVDLVVSVAGGEVVAPAADVGSEPGPRRTLILRARRTQQVLGIPFTTNRLADLLAPIGFDVEARDADSITARVPGFRSYDVEREEDLIEEVARRHGYDNFPDELRPFRPGTVPDHPLSRLEDRLRTAFVAEGFYETRSVPFSGESEGDVALLLPLSSAESRLRRAVLTTLIHRLEHNFAQGAADVRLFELGTAFAPVAEGAELPEESTRLAAVFTGARAPAHWSVPAQPFDAFDLKGIAERIADLLRLELRLGAGAEPAGAACMLGQPGLHFVDGDGRTIGVAGRISPGVIDAPAWAGDVWGLELTLADSMAERADRALRPLPVYPAIERDIALLVPAALAAGEVAATVGDAAGTLLEAVFPFDLFTGKGIPAGMRSIAYRLRFRSPERTLTDDEVDQAITRVLRALETAHGVTRRA
jgi:phenylalanyl-tRNA synthetase beta chain